MAHDDEVTLESMSQAVWYNDWLMEKFAKYLGGDILEIGCGIGNFTGDLKKHGKVWAIDIDEGFLRRASKKVGKGVHMGYGDIERGDYFFEKQKNFDCIVCLNVLEHIKDDRKSLVNLYKLLKPGGHLVLLVPAHQFLFGRIDKSIGHYRRYEKIALLRVVNGCGFSLISAKRLNFLGALGWFVSSVVFRNSRVSDGKVAVFSMLAPAVLSVERFFEPPFGISILVIAKKGGM